MEPPAAAPVAAVPADGGGVPHGPHFPPTRRNWNNFVVSVDLLLHQVEDGMLFFSRIPNIDHHLTSYALYFLSFPSNTSSSLQTSISFNLDATL